jgi:phosphoribosylformimino-5-aminoimidazole carboxamide ribotide isomerase
MSYLRTAQNISLIASGGVSSMDDLYQLEELGCTAAIIGKAIYEGKISPESIGKLSIRTIIKC